MACNDFSDYVGIRNICEGEKTPILYLDDIEGITVEKLSQLATIDAPTGKKLGEKILKSAFEDFKIHLETILPSNFKIKNQLSSICSQLKFTGNFNLPGVNNGIVAKNTSFSSISVLEVPTFKTCIDNTGVFDIVVTDGKKTKTYPVEFQAGQIFDIDLNFKTEEKYVKIYFPDPTVKTAQISADAVGGCGCGIKQTSVETLSDITILGLKNGVESVNQFGIIPCVSVYCSSDRIVCELMRSASKFSAMCIRYLAASKVFTENVITKRINLLASGDKEITKDLSERYLELYNLYLRGDDKKKIKGMQHALTNNLETMADKCISCTTNYKVSNATG